MAFPCADCALLNVTECRITGLTRAVDDECSLTVVQQRDLWMQAKRLVAARGSAREVVIDLVDTEVGGPGCKHIRLNGTLDGSPVSRVLTKDELVERIADIEGFDRVLLGCAEVVWASGTDTPAEVVAALTGGRFYIGPG